MAVRHIIDYYKQVCALYKESLNDIKELEELSKDNLVEPERLESIKQCVAPILSNYKTITWIMFLLNKPNKEKKVKRYDKMYANKLDDSYSPETYLKKSEKAEEDLKKLIEV